MLKALGIVALSLALEVGFIATVVQPRPAEARTVLVKADAPAPARG